MDVVIRLGVRIEMHWPLFSIGTLQLNSSRTSQLTLYVGRPAFAARLSVFDVPIIVSLLTKRLR